jgi:hypothetical protein
MSTRLGEAVITVLVVPRRAGEDPPSQVPDMLVWRGPRAPAAAAAAGQLIGTVDEHTLDGAALGAPRQVTVYRPPQATGPLPGCVLADGQSARGFAQILEPAILAGDVRHYLAAGNARVRLPVRHQAVGGTPPASRAAMPSPGMGRRA